MMNKHFSIKIWIWISFTVKQTQPGPPNVFLTIHKSSSEQKDQCFLTSKLIIGSYHGLLIKKCRFFCFKLVKCNWLKQRSVALVWFVSLQLLSKNIFFPKFKLLNSGCSLSASVYGNIPEQWLLVQVDRMSMKLSSKKLNSTYRLHRYLCVF